MTDTYDISNIDIPETLNAMIVSRIGFYNMAGLHELFNLAGSATRIMELSSDIRQLVPEASPRLVSAFKKADEWKKWADDELQWDIANGVVPLAISSPLYPQRLTECADAPMMLYYMGNADLNKQRIICIIGTRHATAYGQDIISRFTAELKAACPDTIIVSGLAYGVDISAHRCALSAGMETIGVLAHGLDTIYPSVHRDTAAKMITQGGLLSEFPTGTNADKMNFVRRNRIVAGMSDACILVESAEKGGGLITTGIANSYGRDVFAFPGNVGQPYSKGCNNLIKDNKAMLITSAQDFVNAMGWQNDATLREAKKQGIERQLFPEFTADEQHIVDILAKTNDLQINMLSAKSGFAIGKLSSLMFTLEMKGTVKSLAGGICHLIMA